jgi:ABC-type multidrug transport system fused ATPase/permease subunit
MTDAERGPIPVGEDGGFLGSPPLVERPIDAKGDPPSVSLYRYVAARSLGHQIRLTGVVALATVVTLIPIEMQKRLVNEAIGNRSLSALTRYGLLFVLGALATTGLKFALNLYETLIAERVLRDFRTMLYERIVRLPVWQLRHMPPAQLVSIVLAEADELGAFFGQAFSVPLVSGCMLIALTAYLASLSPWTLGLLALHPIEIWVIPRLQGRVNRLSRSRVALGRRLAAHLERSVRRRTTAASGPADPRADLLRFRHRLDRILAIRVRAAGFKYGIKWVGNGVAKLGPFLLFMGGGWLIITQPHAFNLGQLVAALAAYDRLNDPWQELLDYYSAKEIATTRYAQILETVTPKDLAGPPVPATVLESAAAPSQPGPHSRPAH